MADLHDWFYKRMYTSKMKVTFVFFGLGLADIEAYFKRENSSREQNPKTQANAKQQFGITLMHC